MPAARFISASPHAAPARHARRKADRPGELLEAALDLFVEKGFAATRVEEVAARAGVSKGTLFLYFPSKEALFKAVVRENLSGRFAQWNEEYDAFEGSTPDLLRRTLHLWWERVGSTRISGITKLILSEGCNFPELADFYQQEVVWPGHALLRRILLRGIERGEFAPADVDYAIYSLVAPMMFLMLWKHSSICAPHGMALDPAQYLAQQADTVLHGLCVRSGDAA